MTDRLNKKSAVSVASLRRRLVAYRTFAYATGVLLVLLVFVAVPLDRLADNHRGVAILGPTHGFLYMGYIVATLLLAESCRWKPVKAVLILLAGTVPVASFVAERKVTRQVRDLTDPDPAAH